jgi:flagellar hook-length control protein FliK
MNDLRIATFLNPADPAGAASGSPRVDVDSTPRFDRIFERTRNGGVLPRAVAPSPARTDTRPPSNPPARSAAPADRGEPVRREVQGNPRPSPERSAADAEPAAAPRANGEAAPADPAQATPAAADDNGTAVADGAAPAAATDMLAMINAAAPWPATAAPVAHAPGAAIDTTAQAAVADATAGSTQTLAAAADPGAASATAAAGKDGPLSAAQITTTASAEAAAVDAKATIEPRQAAAPTTAQTQAQMLAPAAQAAAAATVAAGEMRDRLLADFERRFELALALNAGTRAEAPSMLPLATPAAGGPHAAQAMATLPGLPVSDPGFRDALAQRITLLATQRVQSAEIALSPADLGPISVSIELKGQEASLAFSAAHATTRTLIEDALPRLREMLAAGGLQLAQAQVGDQAPRQDGSGRPHGSRRSSESDRLAVGATAAPPASPITRHSTRLIDIIV